MSYSSYAFAGINDFMDYTVRLLVGGLVAVSACWLACYGIYTAAVRARAARRSHRSEIALRAEATRGIAEIERFLRGEASGTIRGDSPDADTGEC